MNGVVKRILPAETESITTVASLAMSQRSSLPPIPLGWPAIQSTSSRRLTALAASGLALLGALLLNPVQLTAGEIIAESHFDSGTDNWKQHDDGKPAREVNYEPLGGVSGGGIRSDKDADWFVAPPAFLGDQRAAYGGRLRLVMKQNKSSGFVQGFVVRLESGGLILGRYIGRQPPFTFSPLEFVLDENSGWFNRSTGELATRTEMMTVLSNLQTLHIRSDFTASTDDSAWLDDVVLEGPPAPAKLSLDAGKVLTIQGDPGATFDIEFASRPEPDATWKRLVGITIPDTSASPIAVRLFEAATGSTNQFFRAVRVR